MQTQKIENFINSDFRQKSEILTSDSLPLHKLKGAQSQKKTEILTLGWSQKFWVLFLTLRHGFWIPTRFSVICPKKQKQKQLINSECDCFISWMVAACFHVMCLFRVLSGSEQTYVCVISTNLSDMMFLQSVMHGLMCNNFQVSCKVLHLLLWATCPNVYR